MDYEQLWKNLKDQLDIDIAAADGWTERHLKEGNLDEAIWNQQWKKTAQVVRDDMEGLESGQV